MSFVNFEVSGITQTKCSHSRASVDNFQKIIIRHGICEYNLNGIPKKRGSK